MGGAAGGQAQGAGRFVAGDSLRGIGVIMVFLVHAALAVSLPRGNYDLSIFGDVAGRLLLSFDTAVVIFFCLSGYLISRPFIRAIVQGRPVRAPQYVRRRVARIVPAYLIAFAATLILLGLDGSPFRDVVVMLTLTQAWTETNLELEMMQGWTLSVEAAFYVALPLCAIVLGGMLAPLRNRSPELRAGLVLAALTVVTLLSFWMATRQEGVQGNQLPLANLWSFTPGIALAAIEPLDLRRRLPRWTASAWLAIATGGFLAVYFIDRVQEDLRLPFQMLMATGLLAGGLALHWQGRKPWRAMDRRFIVWFGERSYGIYLWHWIVIAKVLPMTEDMGVWAAYGVIVGLGLAGSMVLGELSWRLVESHALAWAHKNPITSAPVPSEPIPSEGPVPAQGAPAAPGAAPVAVPVGQASQP